ncbi:hypothetical protein KKE06_04610 [Candidatus Micrarchaeota archaeon]|nr:hypothetical protein [Candidatus Micrarchaeota archaeon]MBU1930535.1 hypothetical protein [Candidatus Micrarchaeota archaeon]
MTTCNSKTGALVVGVVLLLIAAYLFFMTEDVNTKWYGSGILAILGVILLIGGCKKK